MKLCSDDGDILCDIAKIRLQENDVIILDFGKTSTSTDHMENIGNDMHEIFPNNKIIFLSNDVELKIIDGGSKDE